MLDNKESSAAGLQADIQRRVQHLKHWKNILGEKPHNPQSYSSELDKLKQALHADFKTGHPVENLLHIYSSAMDILLSHIWHTMGLENMSLIATGGFGRQELHPASDIDLLILINDDIKKTEQEQISNFITFLWDIGLDIGHAVRTIKECEAEALAELATITSLIEARFLQGNKTLFNKLENVINQDNLWNSRDFYQAKMEELFQRNEKYGNSAYKLEPNIKESPGGLRDMHIIGWVTRRHYNSSHLKDLLDSNFLTAEEFTELTKQRNFLWAIRWVLHMLCGRKEDRLLFEYQYELAIEFGYGREARNDSIEAFMQDYYIAVTSLERLTNILLQHFDEEIIFTGKPEIKSLNQRFQITNSFLEVIDESTFKDNPSSILELFLLLQQHKKIKGVRASTIRLLRTHLTLINDEFRADPVNRNLFITMLRQPTGITHTFRQMHYFGVLSAYLPDFKKITGRMQFDLFHIYTVDEHILMVLRNLRRLSIKKFEHELPECSAVFKQITKPECLYISALFHDIAKGRDGDHSKLGEQEVIIFCQQHQLCSEDTQLIAWLVKEHLTMSLTAQRKDISDPEVINTFAQKVKTANRLRCLYLLTVSDIRGTDPKIWNSWKASLLTSLYHNTLEWLHKYSKNQPDIDQLLKTHQKSALQALTHNGFSKKQITSLWETFHPDYFFRFSTEEIVRHFQIVHNQEQGKSVFIRPLSDKGATEILIYSKVYPHFFMQLTRGMQQLNLNILDARIYSTRTGYAIDSFHVLEGNGDPCEGEYRLEEITANLEKYLAEPEKEIHLNQQLSRKQKMFTTPTTVKFRDIPGKSFTEIEITTGDRPGLLADIASIVNNQGIKLQRARITTAGETAKDTLQITDSGGKPLNFEAQKQLKQKLIDDLAMQSE